MRRLVSIVGVLVVAAGVDGFAQHWPAWRGPTHDGVSTEKGLPDTWSATCASTPAAQADDASASGPFAADTNRPELSKRGGRDHAFELRDEQPDLAVVDVQRQPTAHDAFGSQQLLGPAGHALRLHDSA